MNEMPVAVFIGGTSGIGRGMVQALAACTNGKTRIIIVGRNKTAADAIIGAFPSAQAQNVPPLHEFIPCDVSLISNVRGITRNLLTSLEKIDYLVLTAGVSPFSGMKATKEGIDEKMALSYYSRGTFIHDLLPLLRKSNLRGGAKVYSVLGAGQGEVGRIDMDDLALKSKPTIPRYMNAVSVYTDLLMQKFAKEEPNIAFSHAFPGLVRSNMMTSSTWWLTLIYYSLYPFIKFFSQTPEAAGKIHISTCMASPRGFNSYGEMGQSLPYTPADGDTVDALWKHTVELTESVIGV